MHSCLICIIANNVLTTKYKKRSMSKLNIKVEPMYLVLVYSPHQKFLGYPEFKVKAYLPNATSIPSADKKQKCMC